MVVQADGLAMHVQLPPAVVERSTGGSVLVEQPVPLAGFVCIIDLLAQLSAAIELDLDPASSTAERSRPFLVDLGLDCGERALDELMPHGRKSYRGQTRSRTKSNVVDSSPLASGSKAVTSASRTPKTASDCRYSLSRSKTWVMSSLKPSALSHTWV
jgi:hypothetical protein